MKKKRLLAWLLSFALLFSLVPASAMAAGSSDDGTTGSSPVEVSAVQNDLCLKKTITKGQDGYTVQLESYATGTVTTTTSAAPMDIVLVLDVSGSMEETITSYQYVATTQTSWTPSDLYFSNNYYAKIGDSYYRVTVKSELENWEKQYWLEANGKVLGNKVTDYLNGVIYTGALYTYEEVPGSTTQKLKAMQEAVNSFIDEVKSQNVAHRIGIVKLAGEASNIVGDTKYYSGFYTYNHTQVLCNLTDIQNSETLKTAVSKLTAAGATSADLAMLKAKSMLDNRSGEDKNRPAVVIMFTDGEPTHSNAFETAVAGSAINTAKGLKTSGTKVYTIGMFTGANPADTNSNFNKYMNGVSSNYPNAKYDNRKISLGTRAEGDYYFKADNADELKNAFQTISNIVTETSTLDESAVVIDTVPKNFTAPSSAGNVTVYTVPCTGKDNNDTLTWGAKTSSGLTPTVTKNADGSTSISVTGFDFSENWCGLDQNNTAHGQKLVIEFTIQCDNYGGTQPTNAGAVVKDASGNPVIAVDDPKVAVPVDLGITDTDTYTKEKTYDGTPYTFDDVIEDIVKTYPSKVDGSKNAYIDLTYEIVKDGNTIGTYTVQNGKTSGSWSGVVPTIGTVAGTYDGYTIRITGTDAEASNNTKSYDIPATFTIGQRPLTITADSGSKKEDGTPLVVDTYSITEGTLASGDALTSVTVTGSDQTTVGSYDNVPSNAVIKCNGTDVTNCYEITYENGTLTISAPDKKYADVTVNFYKDSVVATNSLGSTVMEEQEVGSQITLNASVLDTYKPNGYASGRQQGTIPYTVNEDSNVINVLYLPQTADLIDDDITIKHSIDSSTNFEGNDTAAHIVKKSATVSYQIVLDMNDLVFGDAPANSEAVSALRSAMGNESSIFAFMKNHRTEFAGSTVDLYVKFSDLLNVPTLDTHNFALTSNLFTLSSGPVYDSNTGYWKFTCTISDTVAEGNGDTILLTVNDLPLTEAAQAALSTSSDTRVISECRIDGEIKYTPTSAEYTPTSAADAYTLTLEGKTAQNTALLRLEEKVIRTYQVTYQPGTGSGTDKTFTFEEGTTFPSKTPDQLGFSAPNGKVFDCWAWYQVKGQELAPLSGKPSTITCDLIAIAQWKDDPGSEIVDDDYFFAIQKIDAQDSHTLNGATFELYQLDKNGKVVNRSVTKTRRHGNENGIALFSVSTTNSYGGVWYYAEVTAPEGYVLDTEEYQIKASDFSSSQSKAIKNADTVRNYRSSTPGLLNNEDHFAYIIGFSDGYVRPYNLITRSETTTIFFRLLNSSVRDKNLLTTNTYTDVPDDYWANTAISTMTGLGIVQGCSTTTFEPNSPITRAEFATICARFDTGVSSGTQTFSDISGHWAEKYIQRAAELGWVKGCEDGTFRPDTYITRAEAMTIINRVLNRIPEDESDLLHGMNVWPDCDPSDWFYLAVQEATNSHDFKHKAGNYESWTRMIPDPDWTRYEN